MWSCYQIGQCLCRCVAFKWGNHHGDEYDYCEPNPGLLVHSFYSAEEQGGSEPSHTHTEVQFVSLHHLISDANSCPGEDNSYRFRGHISTNVEIGPAIVPRRFRECRISA